MPIYPRFPANPAQLHQIVEDIHDKETLPLKYDSDDFPRPKLFRGWVISDVHREIILNWLLKHHPKVVSYDGQGVPHARTTAVLSAELFAEHYGLEGGVKSVHTLDEEGNPSREAIFFFDSNDVVPEERYIQEEWEPLAEALQITEEPRWYLKLIC